MRIMGLDYGSVTVGVAISDERMVTAQPVEVIKRKQENKLRQTLARIEQLVLDFEVGLFLIGYPKNMNNSIGERAVKTKDFAKALERRTGISVVLWDERLSTMAAGQVLIEAGVRREQRKYHIDKIAASLILQGYLNYRNDKEKLDAGKPTTDCNNE